MDTTEFSLPNVSQANLLYLSYLKVYWNIKPAFQILSPSNLSTRL